MGMSPEELKEYRRKYYLEHRDHLRILNLHNYYLNWEKNKERNRVYSKAYYYRKKKEEKEL